MNQLPDEQEIITYYTMLDTTHRDLNNLKLRVEHARKHPTKFINTGISVMDLHTLHKLQRPGWVILKLGVIAPEIRENLVFLSEIHSIEEVKGLI